MNRLSSAFLGGQAGKLAMAAAVAITILSGTASVQQPATNSVEAQRQAMQKLSFLAGNWSGTVSIIRGPGEPGSQRTGSDPGGEEPLKLTQTENVRYKLGGLVLLIEGKSAGADGKTRFEALATIAYDDATGKYCIRAYSGGHYLDTELTVSADGFSWGFQGGPMHIVNTMRLTTTEEKMGDNPPRPTVDMLLDREW